MITPLQLRLARTALGWSAADLAKASKVSEGAILRYETGKGDMYERTQTDLRKVLEKKGVTFLGPGETPDGGYGVRLKK